MEGTQVAIANVDGVFYAFGDNCTHAQCSLAEGDLEGTSVFCPCHGSVFDVTTGAVLAPGNRGELPGPGGGQRPPGRGLMPETFVILGANLAGGRRGPPCAHFSF